MNPADRSDALATSGHVSDELAEAAGGPKPVLEEVDVGRHTSAVTSRTRPTAVGPEGNPAGHDRGSADDNGPREGPNDETNRDERRNVRQTFHLLALLWSRGLERPCGALITVDYHY